MRLFWKLIFCLSPLIGFGQVGNSFDLEIETICLIDSISPTLQVQFLRVYNQNMSFQDRTFDLSSFYNVQGVLKPCEDSGKQILGKECYEAASVAVCDYRAIDERTKSVQLFHIIANNDTLNLNYPYQNDVTGLDSLEGDLIDYLTANSFSFDSVVVQYPENTNLGWDVAIYGSSLVFNDIRVNQIPEVATNFAASNCTTGAMETFEAWRYNDGSFALVLDEMGNVTALPDSATKFPCCQLCKVIETTADSCQVENLTEQYYCDSNVVNISANTVHSLTIMVLSNSLEVTMSGTSITYPVGATITFTAPDECDYLQNQIIVFANNGKGAITVVK